MDEYDYKGEQEREARAALWGIVAILIMLVLIGAALGFVIGILV